MNKIIEYIKGTKTKNFLDGLQDADIQKMALNIYTASIDLDFEDYEETKQKDIEDIENALYYLKAITQNEYNNKYFTTFYNALILIFDK